MLGKQQFKRLGLYIAISSALTPVVHAQVLEEITVTAQRREQSIQEVPISLEAFSGATLAKEGFRAIEDLSNFSPSVEIDVRTQDQDVSIRGMGTTGNNLGLEQAVPIFVDGVHFGRTSMVMGAFLDLERVEVLRGPQPIAFGQNATAGAFSLTTNKPGEEWEGETTVEYGNWGRMSVEGGVGGPITDTLGIRVAGQYDTLDGYIRDVVSGDMFPGGEETAGRVTLQWAPAENFEATLKAEYTGRDREGDGNAVCRVDGLPPKTERAVTIRGLTSFDDVFSLLQFPGGCEDGFERVGIREAGDTSFAPVRDIYQEDTDIGIVDLRTIPSQIMDDNSSHDDMKAFNYRLGLNYTLANGINIDASTGYIDYKRSTNYDNSSSPIMTNIQHRGEIFNMFSQELRVLSERGGTFEWEAGLFYQNEDLDLGNIGDRKYQTVTIRGNLRTPVRYTDNWQDSEWMSAFAAFTFNFMGDKASIDLGARYNKIDKQAYLQGYGSAWIYNINPDPDGDGLIPATNTANSNIATTVPVGTSANLRFFGSGASTSNNTANRGWIINCATGHFSCGTYGAGYWTAVWNSTRYSPDVWHTESPVAVGPISQTIRSDKPVGNGITAPLFADPFFRDYNDNSLDPQVTLRYRPTDDTSLYAKWARAFKGGGADLASGTLPRDYREFNIQPETAENFEIGAKGKLLDGAANYNVSLFQITIDDLQIATSIPQSLGGGSTTANAGKQRTKGLEFDATWAATERLTVGLAGALMDGVMVRFTNAGCTDYESDTADTGECVSAAEAAASGGTLVEGTIDRSGYDAPRTPDWKFVFDLEYWMPVADSYKATFSTKSTYTDGYISNVEDFDQIMAYDTRLISNLNLGFGDMDETWEMTLWMRNALNAGLEYFPEFNADPRGRVDPYLSPRNFRSYGVQLQYNYN